MTKQNPHLLQKESGDFKGYWFDSSLRPDGPDGIQTGGLPRDRHATAKSEKVLIL
jgi:hypothetical protein